MRVESHKTWISTILGHVTAWRKARGWSRESAVQEIVSAHDRVHGPQVTGIRFDPPTTDVFERAKVNADRVFRWLDDSSKDTNLLPVNFMVSILEAMPMDARQHCLDELLRPLGLATRVIEVGSRDAVSPVDLLRGMIAENADAQRAVAALLDGATRLELVTAQRELSESIEATKAARAVVESRLGGVEK